MAIVKKAILQLYIQDVLTDIMPKTTTDMVVMTESGTEVTLASKLASILADVALKANASDVTKQISDAIDDLIDGAPGTYDTLKEISDYIATDKTAMQALNSAIGNKVDKVMGKGLSTNDLTDALKAKIDGLGSLASKSSVSESDLDEALRNKLNAAATGSVIDSVSVNGTRMSVDVNKNVDIPVPVIYAQTTTPSNFRPNDLLLLLVE